MIFDEAAVAVHQLEDIMAIILSWLRVNEIMCSRRVCKKWTEAVKKTIVPLGEFVVNNVESYNAMNVITRAMPNLQQMSIGDLGNRHKYNNGEDPDEGYIASRTADWTTHDIEIVSNFSKLRILEIDTFLNGRYPFLFNSFPLLQKLTFHHCYHLKWDLEILAGLPLLKELDCYSNDRMTGNISSLRVLKDMLEKVRIMSCSRVEGNFMDLADFPRLKELDLGETAVTGDIRDIGDHHFSSLEQLTLPKGVYGGSGYEFRRISDAPDLVRAVYLLKKQRPTLQMGRWSGELSEDSPDRYGDVNDSPPFCIRFVEAGSRVGYRWATWYGNPCEVNWLDPEPDRESSDYGQYIEELQEIENEMESFRGFHQPPTEEEYHRLWEEFSTG